MDPLKYAIIARDSYILPCNIGQQDSASRAIILTNDDGLVVAIPGTDNIACFLADLDIELETHIGMGVLHRGFCDAFLDIGDELLKLNPDVITAHSLGAAIALIYAASLCLCGKPPKAVYAFEPPRISIDNTIAQLLASNGVDLHLTRFGEDIVTQVPRLIHSWQHPSPLTAIGNAHFPFCNVEDHSIDNIVEYYSANQ